MDSKVLLIDIRTGALVRAYDSEAALEVSLQQLVADLRLASGHASPNGRGAECS